MIPLPCMLVCSFVCANRTRDRGCSKHPVFPAPSLLEEGKPRCKPRAQMRREIAVAYSVVIPGRAQREPGIHRTAEPVAKWIPGLRQEAHPGMTRVGGLLR